VGAETTIADSVLWQNVRLGARVTLRSSMVADHCTLDHDSVVEDAVLGDSVTVPAGVRLEPGARLQPGTTAGQT
jgi:NDP-sugar pyrophosphorylase family protein